MVDFCNAGEHSLASVGEAGPEVQGKPSVSSYSAPTYSSDGSRPMNGDTQQKSEQATSDRPTDEQILAQENQIKCVEGWLQSDELPAMHLEDDMACCQAQGRGSTAAFPHWQH